MKINLENMKMVANKLDKTIPTDGDLMAMGIKAEDICNMAYQLQYFFEAKAEIEKKVNIELHRQNDVSYTTGLIAAKIILVNALVDKED